MLLNQYFVSGGKLGVGWPAMGHDGWFWLLGWRNNFQSLDDFFSIILQVQGSATERTSDSTTFFFSQIGKEAHDTQPLNNFLWKGVQALMFTLELVAFRA